MKTEVFGIIQLSKINLTTLIVWHWVSGYEDIIIICKMINVRLDNEEKYCILAVIGLMGFCKGLTRFTIFC